MSFLKQLLTPFVEFDEKKPAEPNKIAPPASPPKPKVPQAADAAPAAHHPAVKDSQKVSTVDQTPVYSPGGIITGPLPEHQQYFEKLVEDANNKNPLFKGADYKEFVDSKLDIDDISDEALKYKTAFNIFKGSGLSKEKLLSTGQEYLNIIGRDLNTFLSAFSMEYKKEVGKNEALIQKRVEELQILTQKATALKKEINQLTQEITLTKDKLNTNKNSFLLAGENKQKEIQSELHRIAQYF
ncbi:MAG: hypothetical protein WKF87_08835 [Chryseolinea sp.]